MSTISGLRSGAGTSALKQEQLQQQRQQVTEHSRLFTMTTSRAPFRPPPAPSKPKRHSRFAAKRGSISAGKRPVFRWLRRSNTFLLTAIGLLVAPTLWFMSRTTTPQVPPTAEDERGQTHLRSTPSGQETGKAVLRPPAEHVNPRSPTPGKPEKPGAGQQPRPPPPPPPTQASPKQPPPPPPKEHSGKEKKKKEKKKHRHLGKETSSPWKPPVLPAEVFRDVPPEECLPNSLVNKKVDPSVYEFSCEEIEVSHAFG